MMFQQLQKYLWENNKKIFLKYDGERTVNKYTVLLIDKNNFNDNIHIDTNNLYEELLKLFYSYIKREEINRLFEKFTFLEDKCREFWSKNVVCIYTIEYSCNFEMYISINLSHYNWRYKSDRFDDICKFIKHTGEKYIFGLAESILKDNIDVFRELAK